MRELVAAAVMKWNRGARLWRIVMRPSSGEWAAYLRKWGGFRHFGENSLIIWGASVSDPHLTWIGNNVVLSACHIVCHDGSAPVFGHAENKIIDAVGPVTIRDNVFIGVAAVVLPNTEIGPNAIVAAGAVVTKDVPEDAIVAGSPARVVGSVHDLVERREAETRALPWYDLLVERGHDLMNEELEGKLRERRVAYFFGSLATEDENE